MMLLHEFRAQRSGDDNLPFRPTLRAALRPATPLHFGNETRTHDDLSLGRIQLPSSVTSLGKHSQYSLMAAAGSIRHRCTTEIRRRHTTRPPTRSS